MKFSAAVCVAIFLVGMCGGAAADPLWPDASPAMRKRATPYNALLSFFGEDDGEDYADDPTVKPTTKPRQNGQPDSDCAALLNVSGQLRKFGEFLRQVLQKIGHHICGHGKLKWSTEGLLQSTDPHVSDRCKTSIELGQNVWGSFRLLHDVVNGFARWCVQTP